MAKDFNHKVTENTTNTWLTPPEIIKSLGEFDLDPCTPPIMPWSTAKHRYTETENGLIQPWFGRVWLNPPYGRELEAWLKKMASYANGIGFVFARTETKAFQNWVFPHVDSMLFMEGRVKFYKPDGTIGGSSTAPSILLGYGEENVECLEHCGIKGKHILVNHQRIIVVGITPTWYSVVSMSARQYGDKELKPIYDMVERVAPDKVAKNPNWKAKVRQKIQVYRTKSVSITSDFSN